MSLDALIGLACRPYVSHVTVGPILYRIEAVDTARLLHVGHAYVEGVQHAMAEVESDAEAAIRAESETQEQAEERLARYRERVRAKAIEAQRAILSTPEGAEAYAARVRAYVCAGVTGMGAAPVALEPAVPGIPPTEHHGPDWSPPEPVDAVRIVDVERDPSVPREDALRAHAAAGEWPLWAIDPATSVVLANMIAALAGGRASLVAPFRLGSEPGAAPSGAV